MKIKKDETKPISSLYGEDSPVRKCKICGSVQLKKDMIYHFSTTHPEHHLNKHWESYGDALIDIEDVLYKGKTVEELKEWILNRRKQVNDKLRNEICTDE